MKQIRYFAILISMAVLLSSCEEVWLDCIEGNNNTVIETREVAEFDEIKVTGPFEVYVDHEESPVLIIDAEKNLIPSVITRVTGEKLYIETEDGYCLRNNHPIKIYVSTSMLKEVTLTGSGLIHAGIVMHDYFNIINTGSGDIEIDYLEAEKVQVSLTGSGDVEVVGTAGEVEIGLLGSGNIRMHNLEKEYCYANTTGSGDTYLNVQKKLKAVITGSGDIYYRGSPNVESVITGTGKVKKY